MKRPRRHTDESLIDWNSIVDEVHDHINSHRAARKALAKLLRAGCDKKAILLGIYLYCGGDPEKTAMIKRVKKEFGDYKKRILALSQQLREVAQEIEAVEPYFSVSGIVCHFTPDTSNLKAYAEFLQRLRKEVFRGLASKRISGRDHHIVFLCRTVRLITGRPHYDELAELIYAVRVGYDPRAREDTDAESLRKRIRRYGRLGPLTILELDELRKSLETSRRMSK